MGLRKAVQATSLRSRFTAPGSKFTKGRSALEAVFGWLRGWYKIRLHDGSKAADEPTEADQGRLERDGHQRLKILGECCADDARRAAEGPARSNYPAHCGSVPTDHMRPGAW